MGTHEESETLELVQLLKSKGGSCLDLDELVHECKGDEAAAINNNGMASQVDYLLDKGLSPEFIMSYVSPGAVLE